LGGFNPALVAVCLLASELKIASAI